MGREKERWQRDNGQVVRYESTSVDLPSGLISMAESTLIGALAAPLIKCT
jgi:hypothetical protein